MDDHQIPVPRAEPGTQQALDKRCVNNGLSQVNGKQVQ